MYGLMYSDSFKLKPIVLNVKIFGVVEALSGLLNPYNAIWFLLHNSKQFSNFDVSYFKHCVSGFVVL